MKVWVLMENEKHEGGSVQGVYSSPERAWQEAGEDHGITFWSVIAVEVDAAQGYQDGFVVSPSDEVEDQA